MSYAEGLAIARHIQVIFLKNIKHHEKKESSYNKYEKSICETIDPPEGRSKDKNNYGDMGYRTPDLLQTF